MVDLTDGQSLYAIAQKCWLSYIQPFIEKQSGVRLNYFAEICRLRQKRNHIVQLKYPDWFAFFFFIVCLRKIIIILFLYLCVFYTNLTGAQTY